MTSSPQQPEGLVLCGLDGSNPLAFLAALGTLRTLSLAWPDRRVKMAWSQHDVAWRPEIHMLPGAAQDEIVESIIRTLPPFESLFDSQLLSEAASAGPRNKRGQPKWQDKLRFPAHTYRSYATRVQLAATANDRVSADLAAAWAIESEVEEVDGIDVARRTSFDFTAGNQAFVAMVRELWLSVSPQAIRNALCSSWSYTPGTSLRWDPLDESRRYALQAINPQDGCHNPILSVPVANVLAVMALPLFPIIPSSGHTAQPGFSRHQKRRFLYWPIWSRRASLPLVTSLLGLSQLAVPVLAPELRERGVVACFRSEIVLPSERYRNFTPATAMF